MYIITMSDTFYQRVEITTPGKLCSCIQIIVYESVRITIIWFGEFQLYSKHAQQTGFYPDNHTTQSSIHQQSLTQQYTTAIRLI